MLANEKKGLLQAGCLLLGEEQQGLSQVVTSPVLIRTFQMGCCKGHICVGVGLKLSWFPVLGVSDPI